MKFFCLVFCFMACSVSIFSQKKTLGPEVYASWNRIEQTQISPNGQFSSYVIRPFKGDPYLYIVNNKTGEKDSILRGFNPVFTNQDKQLVFKITPGFDTLRKLELKPVQKDKWPKDTIAIYELDTKKITKLGSVKQISIPKEGSYIAYLGLKNDFPKTYLSKKEKRKLAKKNAKLSKKSLLPDSDGNLLTIYNLDTKEKKCFLNVTSYSINHLGKMVSFVQQEFLKTDSVLWSVYQFENKQLTSSVNKYVAIENQGFIKNSSKPSMLFSLDTAEAKRWSLAYWDLNYMKIITVVDSLWTGTDKHVLTTNFEPYFINNETSILFGAWEKEMPTPKDTLTELEEYKVDIWHWKDERMQPQQLLELNSDRENSNLYVYHLKTDKIIQLTNDSLDFELNNLPVQEQILASCNKQNAFKTWLLPIRANYYSISVETGKLTHVRSEQATEVSISPNGKDYIYWNEKNQAYFHGEVNNPNEKCITCNEKANWFIDLNGVPVLAEPFPVLEWTTSGAILKSSSALYFYKTQEDKLYPLTTVFQKESNDTNYRYSLGNTFFDSLFFQENRGYVVQFHTKTKDENWYKINGIFPNVTFEKMNGGAYSYIGIKQAKKEINNWIFQRENVSEYPDLYIATTENNAKRISNTNPQQSEYNWASVELLEWKSYDNVSLQGLVYKPENFDPNKSYPMIVYYYEMSSDELHQHSTPRPTASVIFPTEYASAGYIVFMPDIRYKEGHPAHHAYDCIMSGTDAVLKKYSNIDSKRLGLQGQSWGGYQTAQLITMTTRYKCAMAGAPVSDMFSAYGGIRWGSGFCRQFQYEHGQSRIGKTIWEAPELYTENSPIFGLPKVETPLLIMHNDMDGAVPWYQGIELYAGLRRLQKPVWLLNYNGDDHNLMKIGNRIDLSIRMRQFFDFYLLNSLAPTWLVDGLPALEKGKSTGYELKE